MSSPVQLPRPLLRNGAWWSLLALAILGFTDATYLAVSWFFGEAVRCGISQGCTTVTTSAYASIFGIPVSFLGVVYYAALILLLMAVRETNRRAFLITFVAVTTIGIGMSAWFVAVQLFILHAICQWCMISATTTTLLFIGSMSVLRYTRYGFSPITKTQSAQ